MNRIVALFILLGIGPVSVALSGAPLHPANPYPADLATNAPANADLTWTPGDPELIRNGNFESGTLTAWSRVNEGQGPNNNTYITDGTRRPFNQDIAYPPFAGNFSAMTDQDGPGLISMYQDVTLPATAGSVWLNWADQIHNYFNTFVSEDPPQRQEYRVEVRTINNSVLGVIYRTIPGDAVWTGWNKRGFDLTPFKGQTVRIAFVQEQWRSFFHMFYDNISVRVLDTGPVSYDVFFGTNAVPGSNEFRGTVSAGGFALPQLSPQQTYFWRVNTRMGTNVFAGPVWRFTTAPVGAVDHFTWAPILSPQSPGTPFNVLLTARDAFENVVTNFDGAAMVTARAVEGSETYSLNDSSSTDIYAAFENATVGYSFTPNADLIVTGFNGGAKASIWRDDGILIGSQPPIHLQAGVTYRLGMYSPGLATNYMRFDGLSTFAHGTLNQAYEGMGDAFPTQPHPARWFQVSFDYTVNALSAAVLSQSAQFSAGSWNGPVTIPSTGFIQLTASGDGGIVGNAALFEVTEQMRIEIGKTPLGEVVLRFGTVAGQSYLIETSQDLRTWVPFGPAVQGSGEVIERPAIAGTGPAFFRVVRL